MQSLNEVINSTPYKAFIQNQLEPESVLVTGNFKRYPSMKSWRAQAEQDYINEIGRDEYNRRLDEEKELLRLKWDGEFGQGSI